MEQSRKQAAGTTKTGGGAATGTPARGKPSGPSAGSRVAVSGAMTRLGAGMRSIWVKIKNGPSAGAGLAVGAVRRGFRWIGSKLPAARWKRWAIGAVAAVVVVGAVVAVWPRSGSGSRAAGLTSWIVSVFSQTRPVNGRAVVIDSGLLRVGDTPIRLSLLEPVDRDQVCTRAKKRWRCGDAALAALGRIAAGRNLKCEARPPDAAGISLGTCREAKNDIGAALVKSGYAFAATSRYAEEEAEAKVARAGIWSGEADRPDVWRQRVWDEAKLKVTDGCPVKGIMFNGAKVFILPMRAEYDRFRIDPKRGSRWFCSEKEALDAGWKPMER